MPMSKDRAVIALTDHIFRKMRAAFEDVFGTEDANEIHTALMLEPYNTNGGKRIQVIMRPSQFARLLISRNELGISNSFKDLCPKLYSELAVQEILPSVFNIVEDKPDAYLVDLPCGALKNVAAQFGTLRSFGIPHSVPGGTLGISYHQVGYLQMHMPDVLAFLKNRTPRDKAVSVVDLSDRKTRHSKFTRLLRRRKERGGVSASIKAT